jgi:predicted ArsR family transcriptional regulator
MQESPLNSNTYNKEIQRRILNVLRENSPSHISEVARTAGTTRITARKHLERLKRDKTVEELRKGRLRLFVLKDRRERR